MASTWKTAAFPGPVQEAIQALRLDATDPERLCRLKEDQWRQVLRFTDPAQLTLVLQERLAAAGVCERLPPSLRLRFHRNWSDNAERLARTQAEYSAIAKRLTASGVDFVALKGFSHAPHFVRDPRLRVQYDIDLFCPAQDVYRARDALCAMGYESVTALEGFPTDHLPPMVRKTGWRWRGNYFDPELPLSVDLHYRFWDWETERLPAPGVEAFWERRTGHELDLADRLGYAALHALRHLLRGSLRLHQIYEIAYFIQKHSANADFWRRWNLAHEPGMRLLESVVFRLAGCYFGSPRLDVFAPLPVPVERWLEQYAWSPVEAPFRPNKDELYLHVSLLANRADRWFVIRRRMFPMTWPGPVAGVHVPDSQKTCASRIRNRIQWAGFVATRLVFHARAVGPAIWGLARWMKSSRARHAAQPVPPREHTTVIRKRTRRGD